MSKLFGWFNKNKNENKTPEPATNPPQKETSDSNEAIAVEKELPEPEQVEEAQPDVADEADQPRNPVGSAAEEVSTGEPKTPEELVVEPVAAVPQQQVTPEVEPEVEQPPETQAVEESAATEKKSFFGRLKASLSRTKANLGSGIVSLFRGKAIDDDLYEELETQLLVADVGMDTTQKIIDRLVEGAKHSQLKDGDALYELLKQQLRSMLTAVQQPLPEVIANHDKAQGPFVILMVGVNGVGKTTTIGKLAKQFQQQGKKVMLAAGDTFRAAAVEQLQVWGERNNIPVIAQPTGSDSASVLYDALQSAKAKGTDILIADTAGRLQNKDNLMEELKKVVRVMKKLNPDAPHEVMLTVDAATGQNAISQAKLFREAVGLTGITLTKLDGTAKGGVIFAIADKFGIPIRYIGVGEGIDDLRGFNGDEFIDALFSEGEKS
ncbi:MAG TPA: signal recognition particle-docking protein FtsY [Alteromonas sp.]|jgi:fused signal recognition particle receptor|nr:signal recognition particle-docking protein FtsY [Alteromonas sp.]HCB10194.1 signal recognition particle-docking protein FtsY [Alteromonas sp.]HCL13543.1 signal recognition particle-docking protein FtsY [Alteromonas sp.]HCV17203.1 signal recognition particle-docking protein FtsY [Alteromonas sp.]|tara:strand:- start:6517 stop:7824 length:1308 start_codon:yes stop_codon:yes gene_type:complete